MRAATSFWHTLYAIAKVRVTTKVSSMKSYCVSSVAAILLLSSVSYAQSWDTYLNPGFKLGYVFGVGGGFTYGAEISLTRWRSPLYAGAVVSLDYCGETTVASIAIEGGTGYGGAAIGPVLAMHGQVMDFGMSGTLYTGLGIMPYYRLTFVPKAWIQHEVGSFLKIPIRTAGEL